MLDKSFIHSTDIIEASHLLRCLRYRDQNCRSYCQEAHSPVLEMVQHRMINTMRKVQDIL